MGGIGIEYDESTICDICGHHGAYDIYGDYFCDICLFRSEEEDNG